MLQDIGNEIYHCEYNKKRQPDAAKDYLLAIHQERILLLDRAEERLPHLTEVLNLEKKNLRYLFSISGKAFYWYKKELPEFKGAKYQNVQMLRNIAPGWMAFAGTTAYHLAYWYEHNQFCGVCGHALEHKQEERALCCPSCGNIKYPDISVAMVVGVIHENKMLLTRYAHRLYRRYSLVAGFNEIGETLEDTVRREVKEETGLHIKNIRYYGNQPWGFSRALMVGFLAELDGSDKITLEKEELAEAVWVKREDIPKDLAKLSLTANIIRAFGENKI